MYIRHAIIAILLMASVPTWAQKQLHVYHTGDTHSAILPLSEQLADTAVAGRAGFLRRLPFIAEQRKQHPDLLFFDTGDFCQGSAYFTLFRGEVEVGLMNQMGYDAVTIGNHEFDFGLAGMAKMFRQATFPIVCANLDFTGTEVEGLVKPWIVIKRGKVRIGVFGVSAQLDGLVDHNNCRGVVWSDPVETARRTARLLKEQEKCDVVICLSHLGIHIDGIEDEKLIRQTENIDLVLGGHSHTYMEQIPYYPNLQGKLIAADHEGKHGIWVGHLTMNLKKQGKR